MAKNRTAPITLEGEKNAILALVVAGEDERWQIGVHYNRIVERGLAQDAGYPSAMDFFAQEVRVVPQTTLTLYGAVARSFSEADAKRYGISKLGLLLAYESATRGRAPRNPAASRIRIPRGTSFETKPFSDCSATELRAALRAHKGGVPSTATLPAADRKRLAAYRKSLFRALGPHAHPALRAELRGRATVVTLDGIPLSMLPAALAAMSRV